MKKILLIYNIIFLFFGNALFANIHHIHEHDFQKEHTECQECLNFDTNYILDFNEPIFSIHKINVFHFEYLDFNELELDLKNHARAPPISK